jgi:hypothetical protein
MSYLHLVNFLLTLLPFLPTYISTESAHFDPFLVGTLLGVTRLSSHGYCLYSLLHIILMLFIRLLFIDLWCFDEGWWWYCCFGFRLVLFYRLVVIHSKWIRNIKWTWLNGWRRLRLYCLSSWLFVAFAHSCYFLYDLMPHFLGDSHLSRRVPLHFRHSRLGDGPRFEVDISLYDDIAACRVSCISYNVNETIFA